MIAGLINFLWIVGLVWVVWWNFKKLDELGRRPE